MDELIGNLQNLFFKNVNHIFEDHLIKETIKSGINTYPYLFEHKKHRISHLRHKLTFLLFTFELARREADVEEATAANTFIESFGASTLRSV